MNHILVQFTIKSMSTPKSMKTIDYDHFRHLELFLAYELVIPW